MYSISTVGIFIYNIWLTKIKIIRTQKKQENMTYNLEAEPQKYKLFTIWPFTKFANP